MNKSDLESAIVSTWNVTPELFKDKISWMEVNWRLWGMYTLVNHAWPSHRKDSLEEIDLLMLIAKQRSQDYGK